MADNLRITTPIQTGDSTAKVRPNKESSIVNPADPRRVAQKPNQEQSDQNDGLKFLLNQKSVFGQFVTKLASTPNLTQTLQKVMLSIFMNGSQITSDAKISHLNQILTEKMVMTPKEVLDNITYQFSNSTRFSDGIFSVLRDISNHNSDFQLVLGRFLKAYDSYFSAESSLKSTINNLNTLTTLIPHSFGSKLDELTEKLVGFYNQKQTSQGLELLKNQIIPFLGKYVESTNDYGKSRDTITLLVSNLARLNIGSRKALVSSFENLVDYCRYNLKMTNKELNELHGSFVQVMAKSDVKTNALFDSMISLISSGLKSKSSQISHNIYNDVLNSLLLDKNVFMPLEHAFLPINLNGNFIFSEIWIDKNAEDEKEKNYVKKTKMFLTFDINKLGYFEAIVLLSQNYNDNSKRVDVQVNYPTSLSDSDLEIKKNISEIFSTNGMNQIFVATKPSEEPLDIEKVFTNIYERKNSINVTV